MKKPTFSKFLVCFSSAAMSVQTFHFGYHPPESMSHGDYDMALFGMMSASIVVFYAAVLVLFGKETHG